MSLLKANEVTERLGGISLSSLYALKEAGLLVPIRCGVSKGYRWKETEVQAFIDNRRAAVGEGQEGDDGR